jgi:predicted Rdx family selenoprotein
LGVPVNLEPGKPGQFEVLADGQVIAEKRSKGFLAFLGGGWPDPREVVAELRRLQAQSS